MTTEERDQLILEFGRFREQNQREHGELIARIEGLRGEFAGLRGEMEGLRGELRAEMGELRGELRAEMGELRGELRAEMGGLRGDLLARLEAQRADSEKAMRLLLLEIVGIAVVGFGAMVGALALLV